MTKMTPKNERETYNAALVRGLGNGPVAGRFVLLHCGYEASMPAPEWGYVTSWDTWEEAFAAFGPTRGDRIPPGFKLHDDETGREWLAGFPYEWEAAQTMINENRSAAYDQAWRERHRAATLEAVDRVLAERDAQDVKWGEQNHSDEWWLAIITEEVGELAQAILHKQFGGPKAAYLREELIQTAAVALAWIECKQRQWYEQADAGPRSA